jgi:import inner membrane translocase subunit TIM23
MASSSLPLSPSPLRYAWRRNIIATSSRRTVLSSIRFQSTDVSQGAKNTLPWSEYLSIRRGKRKWEMVSLIFRIYSRDNMTMISFLFQALTIPCVLAGLAGGAAYFGSMELDATKPIMVREFLFHLGFASLMFSQGIDPLLFFGGATLGCMGMHCTYVPPVVTLAHRLSRV